MNKPIGVGVIGLGRSGFSIHVSALSKKTDKYRLVAVCDPIKPRVNEVSDKHACRGFDSIEEVLEHPDVELVIVATPNIFHVEHVLMALRAGKHVVCEKPFGYTTKDVDEMIAESRKSGKIVQPFQQRRYEDDFLKVKEVCESGALGKISFIRICWHGFNRRWDWQTTRKMGGGQLFNNGPHLVDHALELFGPKDPEVWCDLRNALSSGDAEDEFMVVMRAEGCPTIQAEILATSAYPQPRWYVCGTKGSLVGTTSKITWKTVDWSQLPEPKLSLESTPDRSYNSEKLTWKEETWEVGGSNFGGAGAQPAEVPVFLFYDDVWKSIRTGAPQVITQQSVRRRVAVMEQCHKLSGIPSPSRPTTIQNKKSKKEICHA